jgi:hypothetical protein
MTPSRVKNAFTISLDMVCPPSGRRTGQAWIDRLDDGTEQVFARRRTLKSDDGSPAEDERAASWARPTMARPGRGAPGRAGRNQGIRAHGYGVGPSSNSLALLPDANYRGVGFLWSTRSVMRTLGMVPVVFALAAAARTAPRWILRAQS